MDYSEEYIRMEMECEPKKSFRRGRSWSRQTGILVLLGTVCMIIFLIMTSVIFSHQERKFSMLESWMSGHSSNISSVKSDFQITGSDLEKKVSELQNLVSSLSSSLNMSGASNTMTNEMHAKKLSNIESLITDLGSSQRSLASKEDLLQTLMSHWISSQRFRPRISSFGTSSSDLEELKSSIRTLSYKLSFTYLFPPGCFEIEWIPFNNSCYLFSRDTMNWTQAKDYCEEQGALLLKTEDGSEKEWKFLTNFAKPQDYWVGLTDQNTGIWRWADDTPYVMNKAQWRIGQPDEWTEHNLGDKGEEGEDCVQFGFDGFFNDIHCSSKLQFICKKGNLD
ncbi:asialoglycoprotein receptor 2 [Pimephales promelas]|uniref:asialoglycoprotein receptor 2 n=1 Tax=Pimephales promelas TaxID=90988 RepID=UPI0019559D09|nr:asialoglycoprotein receptor 2 [Pimephales promelas]